MCIECYRTVIANTLLMFEAGEGCPPITDAARVLRLIAPGMRQDGAVDSDALGVVMTDMDVQRIGAMAKFCGYMTDVLDELNATAMSAMHALADAGHPGAIRWMARNHENIHQTDLTGSFAAGMQVHAIPPTGDPTIN